MAKKAAAVEVNEAEEKEVKKKTTRAKKKVEINDLFDEIEKRSYEIYLEREGKGEWGTDSDDWFRAELEVKARYGL
jgi:hypothetical protein